MKGSIISVAIVFLLITGCSRTQNKGAIQIKGSDTMINLNQMWAEEFTKIHPDINVAVTGGGSGTGIASFLNGSCDIIAASREMEKNELELAYRKGLKPVKYIVAYDGIAVVVNPKNKVDKLTADELRNIFMGSITNWRELGGDDAKIVILSREVNSGTHIFFKEHILRKGNAKGNEEYAADALLMSSSQAIADEISINKNAIGYYGMAYISDRQKAVKVARDKNSPYFSPTSENVRAKKYFISRPLYMYINKNPREDIKEFLDFVLSKEGQEAVKKIGFVPAR